MCIRVFISFPMLHSRHPSVLFGAECVSVERPIFPTLTTFGDADTPLPPPQPFSPVLCCPFPLVLLRIPLFHPPFLPFDTFDQQLSRFVCFALFNRPPRFFILRCHGRTDGTWLFFRNFVTFLLLRDLRLRYESVSRGFQSRWLAGPTGAQTLCSYEIFVEHVGDVSTAYSRRVSIFFFPDCLESDAVKLNCSLKELEIYSSLFSPFPPSFSTWFGPISGPTFNFPEERALHPVSPCLSFWSAPLFGLQFPRDHSVFAPARASKTQFIRNAEGGMEGSSLPMPQQLPSFPPLFFFPPSSLVHLPTFPMPHLGGKRHITAAIGVSPLFCPFPLLSLYLFLFSQTPESSGLLFFL